MNYRAVEVYRSLDDVRCAMADFLVKKMNGRIEGFNEGPVVLEAAHPFHYLQEFFHHSSGPVAVQCWRDFGGEVP